MTIYQSPTHVAIKWPPFQCLRSSFLEVEEEKGEEPGARGVVVGVEVEEAEQFATLLDIADT